MQIHNGTTALVQKLKKIYIIYKIHALTRQMTKEYPNCQRNKFLKHKPYRGLQPVEVLSELQEVISQDFIIKLLKLKNSVTGQLHNAILIIIDRLTKWDYFVIYTKEILAKDIAQTYIKEVFL